MKSLTLLLLIILLLTGCAKKKRISGSYYIPREEMVNILTDIYLMDGITDSYKFYRIYQANDTLDMNTEIFNKYSTDFEHFDSTLKAYSAYPELLDDLYDDVIMNLSLLQDSIDMKPPDSKGPHLTR